MRPLHLTLQAFGPFASSEAIDFTQLGDRAFFLIHGPTGAGKTTLLDAICFALYGDTSGGERSAQDMRSANAAPGTRTEVTLEFALGGERYRVTRSPAQLRPSQRGGGMVNETARAQLDVLTAAGWTSKAGQPAKVTEAVRTLLGFDSAQFRQVIVLPQGRFRELLTADSKARQAILERLFRTELYRRVEELLKGQAAEIKREADRIGIRRETLLRQHELESVEALAERIVALQAEVEQVRVAEQAARVAQQGAQAALQQGEQVAARLAEWQQAEQACAALQAREPGIDAQRAQLEAGRRAAQVMPADQARQGAVRDHEAARAMLAQAEAALTQRNEAAGRAGAVLAAEHARAPDRQARQRELIELEGLLPRAKTFGALQQALDLAQAGNARAQTAHEQAQARVNQCLARHQATSAELDQARQGANAQQATELRLAAARERAAKLAQYRQAERTLAQSHDTLAARERTGRDATAARDAARAALREAEAAWRDGQAAILAAGLADGAACPVCGSTAHPAPARHGGGAGVGFDLLAGLTPDNTLDGRLDRARAAAQRAEDAALRAAGERQAAQGAVTQTQLRLTELAADAGDISTAAEAALASEIAQHGEALAAAQAAAKRVQTLSAQLAAQQAEHAAAQTAAGDAAEAARQAANELARLQGEWQAACAQVPPESRDPAAIAAAIGRTRAALAALDTALQAAQAADRQAAADAAAASAARAAALDAGARAGLRVQESSAAFAEALAASAFADATAYAAARMTPAQMAQAEGAVRAFDLEKAGATDRRARAAAAAESLTAPDLPALREALAAATRHVEQQVARQADLSRARESLLQCQRLLDQLAAEGRDIEARFAVLGRLAEVANGNNPRRMTFQRFVLATLLDEVLEAASMRLLRMSRGRYALQRVREQGDLRSAGGLDLEVFDHDTGSARPANTLSGGEGFLASLSLALGLADVVQSRAGGIQLDTLFVDEGFGTLDPESLDFAIRTLLDLQQAGRLVGIISHVTELRERIDVRLEVRPGVAGSRAVLQLP